MPNPDEPDIMLDFGDEELNDPNYEQNVGNDDNVTTTDTTTDGQQQAEPQATDEGQAAQGGEQQQQDAGAGSGTDEAGQQQQRQDGDTKTSGPVKADDKGNLVDGRGNIVAAAGAERRHYERAQAAQRTITRLEQELQEAKSQDYMSQALNGAPKELGLDMQETQMGLQAIAAFKKDPVATAQWMLQETMRLGYTLPQIVGGDAANGQVNSGSLDLQAVRSMISEAVQPLVGDREAQQQETQRMQAAQREYDTFLAKHDFADVHEDALAGMLKKDASLTPETAYWRLREFASRNGLDFSKPLREQVQSRAQSGNNASNGNATPQAQQERAPMPNGGAPTNDMRDGPVMADPNDAWDTIVRQSLRDAGFN